MCQGCFVHEQNDNQQLGLSEARRLFETEFSIESAQERSHVSLRSGIWPGDYTPIWEDALKFKDDDYEGFVIPFLPEFAVFSYKKTNDNIIHRPWRKLQQDIIVRRNIKTGERELLLRSIVKKHGLKVTEKYSGIIIYSSLTASRVYSIEKYVNDSLVSVVFLDGKMKSAHKAAELIRGYSFAKKKFNATRRWSDDEDDWDWWEEWDYDWNDVFGFFHYGDDIYYDPFENRILYDSDGDGTPDILLDDYLDEQGYDEPDDFFETIDVGILFEAGLEGDFFDLGEEPSYIYSTHMAMSNLPQSGDLPVYSFRCAPVLAAFKYGSDVLGGVNTQEDYLNEYVSFIGDSTVVVNGLSSFAIRRFVTHCFATSELNSREDIRNAIDAGHIVYAFIVDDCSIYQPMIIIGYNSSTNTFIYVYGEDGCRYEENQYNKHHIKKPAFALNNANNFHSL